MNRLFARITCMAFLLVISAAGAISDELWDHAVDLYDAYANLLPGRMSVRFDQYNGRGELVSSDVSKIEIEVGPSGEVEGRTTYASKNGEDITDERQNDPRSGAPFGGGGGDQQSNSPFAGLQKSPFDPSEQAGVTVIDTGRSETIDGVRTRVHLFQHSTGGENMTTGTAWIAEATGAPVRLTASIEPLPGYIDRFQLVQTFETDSKGRWYMTRMEFVGEGNILFIRRRIESAFEFSEYFLPPPESLH